MKSSMMSLIVTSRAGIARWLCVLLIATLGVLLAFGVPHPESATAASIQQTISCTIYVDHVASGLGNGSSWEHAYPTLQEALTTASAGDQICVARGVYKPGLVGNRFATFNVLPGVAVYGGYPNGGGDRDYETNVTVLSGDIDNNDVTDLNGVVLNVGDIVGNNVDRVVTMDGTGTVPVSQVTRLDGFTITAGFSGSNGGGLYCNGSGAGSECSPTIANVVFVGNRAGWSGGGMYNDGIGGISSPVLTNVSFRNNWGDLSCGGIYNDGRDGGVSSPVLNDVVFNGNRGATYFGGAMLNDGSNGASSPILTNVSFNSNWAEIFGGGMANFGYNGGVSNPTLTNVVFSMNFAQSGGGLSNYGYLGESSPTLNNVVFSRNRASSEGGGIRNFGFEGVSSPVLNNVTFSRNEAYAGGGMHSFGGDGVSSPVVTNAIFWDNTAVDRPQIFNMPPTAIIRYSVVQGSNGSGSSWDGWLGNDGGGNIDQDPLFVDAINHDLRLQSGSPAIDTGTTLGAPSIDIRGLPRPVGAGVDMGAYEYQDRTLPIMSGSGQTAPAGQPFDTPLAVMVSDDGTPVSGIPVTFTPPADGLRGIKSSDAADQIPGLTVTEPFVVVTDDSGMAVAYVTANGVAGSYVVIATAPGVVGSVVFNLENTTPLAVTLAAFDAQQVNNQIDVTWQTVSELDNVGFNLYRSTTLDGERMLLGHFPSQNPGSTQGAIYDYTDIDVISGTTYYYWLDGVDINGLITPHGPVSVDYVVPTAVTVRDFGAEPASVPSLSWLLVAIGVAALLVINRRRSRV